jgi:hypothetical protein
MVDTRTVSAERVLQLLRQLPPRDRLRVVAEVLPGLEQALPDTRPDLGFWEGADMQMLAETQGVPPVDDLDALLGSWPEDESVDDFMAAVRECRRQNPAEVSA